MNLVVHDIATIGQHGGVYPWTIAIERLPQRRIFPLKDKKRYIKGNAKEGKYKPKIKRKSKLMTNGISLQAMANLAIHHDKGVRNFESHEITKKMQQTKLKRRQSHHHQADHPEEHPHQADHPEEHHHLVVPLQRVEHHHQVVQLVSKKWKNLTVFVFLYFSSNSRSVFVFFVMQEMLCSATYVIKHSKTLH